MPEQWRSEIEEGGYVIVPNAIDERAVGILREELSPYLQSRLVGRNDFEGTRSERVYRLLAKTPSVAVLIEHEAVLAVADHFLAASYLPSAALGAPAPPRPAQGVSTIWAPLRSSPARSSIGPVRIGLTRSGWASRFSIVSRGCDSSRT